MNQNNMPLVLRMRSSWESADSGILLLRQFFRPIYLFFLPTFLLAGISFRFLFTGENLWMAYFTIWWLKPLWDRLILFPLSRLFFNPDTRLRSLRKGMFLFAWKDLLRDLTFTRLSLFRSYRLPMNLLEGLKGQKRKKRVHMLSGEWKGSSAILTMAGLFLEATIMAGEIFFFYSFVSLLFPFLLDGLSFSTFWVEPVLYSLFLLHIAIVEPLYVAGGFALYINRRILTEGWDLEIKFRQFSAQAASKMAGPLMALVFVASVFFFPPEAAAEPLKYERSAPVSELETILSDPSFGKMEKRVGIRLKDNIEKKEEEDPQRNNMSSFGEIGKLLGVIFGNFLKYTLLALFLGFLIYLIYRNRHIFLRMWNINSTASLKTIGVAEDERMEPEPSNRLADARQLYSQGNKREAWASLYKAMVGTWEEKFQIYLGKDRTEGECLRIVKKNLPSQPSARHFYDSFKKVVEYWLTFAYGHRIPLDETFWACLEACDSQLQGSLN